MPTEIKICGLSDPESVDAALDAGADYLGFVFFGKSPRNVAPGLASELAARARGRARIVALTVDAADAFLGEVADILQPDLIQAHGSESAGRLAQIRALTGVPVMKAAGIASPADLPLLAGYAADRLLLDAKPPAGGSRPGGNGAPFDWSILAGVTIADRWFLSGGLHPANVGEAIRAANAPGVDVSSGVESSPGRKDPALIRAFVAAVRESDRQHAGGRQEASS